MKLEVGMYVRTKEGYIDEVIIEYKGYCNNPNCKCKHVSCKYNYYDEDMIVKASHNIIDLIEVGDYVNGEKVIRIYEKGECYDGSNYGLITKTIETENDNYETIPHDHLYTDYSIKSIVTSQQFSAMEYRLGDK